VTGVPPFFPPPEPIPQLTVPPLAVAPPPDSTPPAAQPTPAGRPQLPAPRKSRTGLIVAGALVAILLVGGLLVGAVVALVNVIGNFPQAPIAHEPIDGAPGPTVAAEPMQCPDHCFTADAAPSTIPPGAELDAIGLTKLTETWGGEASLQEAYDATATSWRQDRGTPTACFDVYSAAPMAAALGSPPGPTEDVIKFLGSHSNRSGHSIMYQTVRIFPTSQGAVEHLAGLDEQLQRCSAYDVTVNGVLRSSSVTRAAAVQLPDSVAAVGWVETSSRGNYFAFDLQRSNMVVRTYLITDGQVSESQFRALITNLAVRVSKLDPSITTSSYVPPTGCEQVCLTVKQASALAPTEAALGALGGLSPDPGNSSLAPTPIGPLWDAASATYATGNGDPYNCFFTLSTAPINSYTQDYNERKDLAVPLGSYSDGSTTLTETAHVYVAEVYAGHYLRGFTSPLKTCAHFSYTVDDQLRTIDLSTEQFDTGSSEVTSVAWTERSGDTTKTVIDLVRRNVTVRVTLTQPTGSALTQDQIAQYVTDVSQKLQAMG
jgi:hypothetical protein